MPVDASAIQRVIEVEGSRLAADVESQLEGAVVVDRLAMPDMFEITFRDPQRDVLERAQLEIGKKVSISTAAVGADEPGVLIKGEVTAIEVDYDAIGALAVVRGYDLSHRLTAGRKTQTFQNVKYSDIAKQIASDAGLQADVDDDGPTVEHVMQTNSNDLEFLYGLASRLGFDCRVDDETLLFKKPTESGDAPGEGSNESEDPTQLVWNTNLLSFRGRMSAVAQVSDVKVRGWDVSKKEAVIGQAQAAATNAEVSLKPGDLAGKVGGQTYVVVDRPVGTQEDADALAAAQAEQIGSAAFGATALVRGSPALKAGVPVNVSGVDKALTGKWVVSSSRHSFAKDGYTTELAFDGRQDRSISGLLGSEASRPGTRIPGIAIAIVTNNDDPENLARVKVKYPWLADDVESHWARVAVPGAGKDTGLVILPEVGDEVVVAFDHGDMAYPIVLGGLWNGKDTPPLGDSLHDAGLVKRKGYISRNGHKIVVFDADDDAGIALITSDGKLKVSLNETDGEVHIAATQGKLVIEAQSIEIKADQEFKVDAGGQLKLKGASVAIN